MISGPSYHCFLGFQQPEGSVHDDVAHLAEIAEAGRNQILGFQTWGGGLVCSKCGQSNPADAKFCGRCGAIIQR